MPRRSSCSAISRTPSSSSSRRSKCAGRRSRRRRGWPSCKRRSTSGSPQALPFTEGAAAGDQHAVDRARARPKRSTTTALRAGALSVLAFGRFRAGVPGALSLVDQAIRLTKPAFDARQRREINVLAAELRSSGRTSSSRARMLLAGIDRRVERARRACARRRALGAGQDRVSRGPVPRSPPTTRSSRGRSRRQYTIDDREDSNRCLAGGPDRRPSGELDRVRALVESDLAARDELPIDRSGDDGSARARRAVERPPGRGRDPVSRLLTRTGSAPG